MRHLHFTIVHQGSNVNPRCSLTPVHLIHLIHLIHTHTHARTHAYTNTDSTRVSQDVTLPVPRPHNRPTRALLSLSLSLSLALSLPWGIASTSSSATFRVRQGCDSASLRSSLPQPLLARSCSLDASQFQLPQGPHRPTQAHAWLTILPMCVVCPGRCYVAPSLISSRPISFSLSVPLPSGRGARP